MKLNFLSKVAIFAIVVGFVVGFGSGFWLGSEKSGRVLETSSDFSGQSTVPPEELELADVGGETPQAALSSFVAALEVGDSSGAARYFTLPRAEKLQNFLSANRGDVQKSLSFLNEALQLAQNSDSSGKTDFSIETPVLIKFKLSKETKLWKIETIKF